MLLVALTSARADDHDAVVSKSVLSSFTAKFSSAQNISWRKEGMFNKATFTYNNQVLFAYFENDGTFIATARNILSDKLPIHLLLALRNQYTDCWITDLVEVDSDWSLQYYIKLENPSKILTLRSDNGADWEVYSKIKKDSK
jgi:hypothetical protein